MVASVNHNWFNGFSVGRVVTFLRSSTPCGACSDPSTTVPSSAPLRPPPKKEKKEEKVQKEKNADGGGSAMRVAMRGSGTARRCCGQTRA